ncbi:MAG: beta-N-acetylhexosaminidase [Mariprofundaceae bacterium]
MNRHLVIGLQGVQLSREETHILRNSPPLGVILFARNCASSAQVKALIDALRQVTGEATWAVIDEEGGRVNRMPWPPFSGRRCAADYRDMAGGDSATAEKVVYQDSLRIGQALAKLGFTHNCAPVLDVFHADGHTIIGGRAYAADVEMVARSGAACMRGLHDAGIEAVGKHFPGHGRANADSHLALPQVDAPFDTLLAEADGFRLLIEQGLRHVMTAHVVYRCRDDKAATFSSFWVQQVLRRRFAFSGQVWSDDLCMQGAGGDAKQAAAAALAAGCDVLLLCEPEAVHSMLGADVLGSVT